MDNKIDLCKTCGMYLKDDINEYSIDADVKRLLQKVDDWNSENQGEDAEANEEENAYLHREKQLEWLLPQVVCSACLTGIIAFDVFCKRAKENRKTLLRLINEEIVNTFNIEDEADLDNAYENLANPTPLMEAEPSIASDNIANSAVSTINSPTRSILSLESFKVATGVVASECDEAAQRNDEVALDNATNDDEQSQSPRKRRMQFNNAIIKLERMKLSNTRKSRTLCNPMSNSTTNNNSGNSGGGTEPKAKYRKPLEQVQTNVGLQENGISTDDVTNNDGRVITLRCMQCNQSFAERTLLFSHVRNEHSGRAPLFKCNQCDMAYGVFDNLLAHIKQVHDVPMRLYRCNFYGCDCVFKSPFAIATHKRIDHGSDAKNQYVNAEKRRFHCHYCEKSFMYRSRLIYHEAVHRNEKPYVCEICFRAYRYTWLLMKHQKKHDKKILRLSGNLSDNETSI